MTQIMILAGVILGAFWAKARGGGILDMLQYAAVLAIIFGVVTAIISIALTRTL